MEYLDVLDEKGNKTGEVKSKPEIHKNGLWHRTVHIWLMNSKDELLLQMRSKTKDTYPGCWDVSAAGHISAGEDSLLSAERELFEELGITIAKNDFVRVGEVTQQAILNNGAYFNNEFNDIYLVKTDLEMKDFKFNDGEVEKVQYISKEEFKKWVDNKNLNLVSHPEEYGLLLNYLK